MSRDAALVVADRGYLRVQRQWRRAVSGQIDRALFEVESDTVVPVEVVSSKREYAAATIRPRIHRHLDRFMKPVRRTGPKKDSLGFAFDSVNLADLDQVLDTLDIDRSVMPVDWIRGGSTAAHRWLKEFLDNRIDHFADLRNDPSQDYLSNMSPYLHFGQISPLYVALQAAKRRSAGTQAFLEELIVRRELSMNFAWFNRAYDSYSSLPEWARVTLDEHRRDLRPAQYSRDQLERAQTHDPYWNASQREMVHRGKMHGYMRMYWGKKILEWSPTPEEAFAVALYLNNRYEIDGRDANGFTGVAWCFGNHDRPWKERPIFGKVRYMNDRGLRRKFDVDSYVRKTELLVIGD
jgi:deoxyribodipyrimidine photo-lyase